MQPLHHANCSTNLESWGEEYCKLEDIVYDFAGHMKSSAVADLQLVCQNYYLRPAIKAIYMFGMLVGSVIFGHCKMP